MPGLLLLVPEHPEVAEEERDRRDDPADVAEERAAVADRAAAAEIDDADPERLLAEGLAGRALEVRVVGDAERGGSGSEAAFSPTNASRRRTTTPSDDPVDERRRRSGARSRSGARTNRSPRRTSTTARTSAELLLVEANERGSLPRLRSTCDPPLVTSAGVDLSCGRVPERRRRARARELGAPPRRAARRRRRARARRRSGALRGRHAGRRSCATGSPEGETLLVLLLLFVLPEAIYDTALIGSRNQTFGKMALGIKVVDAESRAPIGYAARVPALALDRDAPGPLHHPDGRRPPLAAARPRATRRCTTSSRAASWCGPDGRSRPARPRSGSTSRSRRRPYARRG